MERYCKAVLQQESIPIEDKLRVYTTWLDSLGNSGDIKQAVDETLRVLRKFGIRFPKNKTIQASLTLSNVLKVKRGLKRGTLLKQIVSLPIESDPVRLKLLHLMDRLTVYLYYIKDDMMPLVMFRNLQWTLKYGLNNVTPASLTTMGIIFAGILGDLKEGSDCAQTALDLISKSKVSPLVEGRTLFVAHFAGVIWTSPMRDMIKPLQRAYNAALRAGDKESACWAIYCFILYRFQTGFSLDLVIKDVEVYMPQMLELNQIVAYHCTLGNYQWFMNLAGRAETDPFSLVGDFLSIEDHKKWSIDDAMYEGLSRHWKCYLLTVFGEHHQCADLAIEHGISGAVKSNPGSFSIAMFEVFAKGISSFVAARATSERLKRRKYMKNALALRKRVRQWIEKGARDVGHLNAFFDAEHKALKGKHFSAILNYQVAVTIAARNGYLLDAGLFSETFGEYLLSVDDKDEASFRLQEAVKYYQDFGARRKVAMLEEKHRKLLSPESLEIAMKTEGSNIFIK